MASTRKMVTISAATHAALKLQANDEGVSLTELAERLLAEALGIEPTLTDAAVRVTAGPRMIYCDAGTRRNGTRRQ